MKAGNKMQEYIYKQEKKWFLKFQPFLEGKILKVGNGLGYFANFISETNPELKIIDVHKNNNAVNKEEVITYNGEKFPFRENTFDCVVCTFVLHHTPCPMNVLSEMRRTSKRLIILEETYSNLFSKTDLVYRDILVNTLAGQPSKIYWGSYFKKGRLEKIFSENKLKIINHQIEQKRSYWKELFVVE